MDKRTIRAYDIYYEVYDAETADFWFRFPHNEFEEFTKSLPGNKVLNLGSGPGRDSLMLRDHGLEVVCLDGSENMVRETRKLGFESICSDFRCISFPPESFDGIWAYSSLIHVTFEETVEILKKVHPLLRKDGKLYLGFIEGSRNETVRIAGSKYSRYFEYYDEAKLSSLFEETGFKVLRVGKFRPGNHTYLNILLSKESL